MILLRIRIKENMRVIATVLLILYCPYKKSFFLIVWKAIRFRILILTFVKVVWLLWGNR